MSHRMNNSSLRQYDYILDKPSKKFLLIESEADDGGSDLPVFIDSFLMAVIEAYGMVGEMTTSDKQQVSSRLAAIKEMAVQSNHEMKGGSFNGGKWKSLARSVMDALNQTVSEARRAQMLRQLQLCENNLEGILKCAFLEIFHTEYKRLLANSARLLEYIFKYLSLGTIRGQKTQNVLLLCASQLQKLFHLLLRALEISDLRSDHYSEAKDYVVKRMQVCMLKIRQIVEGKTIQEEEEFDDLGGGLFIFHMDQALSFLAVFESPSGNSVVCDQWRSSVEAVLQHAMLIAQIASQFDFKMIHASGEKILRVCENLEVESKSPKGNPAVCKLHAASLSHALEELEQRVSASVLKMYLQVFSSPLGPLQALCGSCWSDPATGVERREEDLTDAICVYDAHTERILQVALFAIACSEDQRRVLGIRSCLASLESLEAYLVPALTTCYLKQTHPERVLSSLLVEHWSSEMKELQQLIDGIVDPAALTQVTHNVIWSPTAVLKKSILTNNVLDTNDLKKLVKSVVSNAEVLSNQLRASEEELHLSQNGAIKQALEELILAVREGKAVLQRIEGQNTTLSVDRILKRCELLVSCVGKLQPMLEKLDDREARCVSPEVVQLPSPSETKNDESPKTISSFKAQKLKELGILGLPLDADIEIDTTDSPVTLDLMQSVLDKTSAQPRFATSFLYNERSKTVVSTTGATPRGVNFFSRKPLQIEPQHLLQQTFSLDVPKLTSLSETLRCPNNSIIHPLSASLRKFCDELEEENASSDISTPERLHDLQQVQNRINAVKISSESCN